MAGSVAFLCWYEGELPSGLNGVGLALTTGPQSPPPALDISALLILTFSLVVGLTVMKSGIRRCWLYLVTALVLVPVYSIATSRLFGIDLLPLPVLFGAALSLCLVQVFSLWQLDRRLSKTLLKAESGLDSVKTAEAKSKLASGIKLLNTVLPLNEAVVFQCTTNRKFQTVAQFKGEATHLNEANRHSVWRDGVKLCERAVATSKLVLKTPSDGGPTNVAVPLQHEQQTVGVLLVRLNESFREADRPLLEAVGAQFARNLTRDILANHSGDSSRFAFFSTSGTEKKLDALYVLRALITEQRCEASALTIVDDGVAIAYLDGTIALANSALLNFAEITQQQLETLDIFSLLDRFRTDVFDEPAIAVSRVLQTGVDSERELNFDQRNQILGLRISLLRENETHPIGIAICVRDLTRIKEYEKLKSDMISLMSHELRTPLTSINALQSC